MAKWEKVNKEGGEMECNLRSSTKLHHRGQRHQEFPTILFLGVGWVEFLVALFGHFLYMDLVKR